MNSEINLNCLDGRCVFAILLSFVVVSARRRVLQISAGIDEPDGFVWELTLCLSIVWVMVYFCVWRGVSWGGKVSVVWVREKEGWSREGWIIQMEGKLMGSS